MARIRSVKPELWNDPDFVACSPLARLLFVGTWNYADDYGVLKDDPDRLRLQILPGDAVDAHALVAELVAGRFLERKVAADGTPVLVIRTFLTHQKIDKRAAGRYGAPCDLTDPPPPIPTTPTESPPTPPLERNGGERTGTEETPPVPEPSSAVALLEPERSPKGDVVVVFEAWKQATGHTRSVLDGKRRRVIVNALKTYPLEDVVDAVRGWKHSPHHRGQNERRTVYNELDLLLRDAARIEQFRDLERGQRRPSTPSVPSNFAALEGLSR